MNNTDIQNLIKELIEKTTVPVKDITISEENGSKTTWFSVEVNQPHFFINHGGEALFALNHLVKKIVEASNVTDDKNTEQKEMSYPAILVDINGFQKKRIENIHAIAHMMAERARYFKSNIEVDPMTAFERRIVHEFLAEATDLKTESTGEGLSRRVVIKYIGNL
ncbi:MAG TPA: R3H domain-containing nucleic acid-binding protein [Candidatus Paceibacterota bacterium]|nr:R3H domain-containing nucleic acid-binding protein [Candidatus Paceibacterota bacterium]HPT18006.1 R3H domain-containing nucleic acid-binding protein [Candidatus Paceibacterota bacterium]